MLRFVLCLLYFLIFHLLFYLLRVMLDERFSALASHLHVFCFQSEEGVKSLRNGGGGFKNFRNEGVTDLGGIFAGGSVPHYMPWCF